MTVIFSRAASPPELVYVIPAWARASGFVGRGGRAIDKPLDDKGLTHTHTHTHTHTSALEKPRSR